MGTDLRMAYLEMRRVGKQQFPPEFLEYLYRFVFSISLKGKDFQHLSPSILCKAFPVQIKSDFGEMSTKVLSEWRVTSFGDLGRAIFQLAEFGCFKLNEQDSLEEYESAGPIHIV
jgi:uncharacterized repeat protein (TIGR04138 family)